MANMHLHPRMMPSQWKRPIAAFRHFFLNSAKSLKSMPLPFGLLKDVIGTGKDASPGDYIKICAAYGCPLCMGEEFDADKAAQQYGQSQEEEKNKEEESQFKRITNSTEKNGISSTPSQFYGNKQRSTSSYFYAR
jgi:hypothetical protein